MNFNILYKILLQSIKENFSGKIWKYLIGSSGSLFAVLYFGKNFLHTSAKISITIAFVFLFSLFIIRFILFLIKNSFKHLHKTYRESKYGEAIIFLRDAFSRFHWLRKKEDFSDEELISSLIYLCDNLRFLFSQKNMCECSVSIKVPVEGAVTADTSVKNLCRDTENKKIRDNANYEIINHTIIGNTAFRKVVNNVLRKNKKGFYYLNNNIPETKDYDNTSREAYHNGELPYKSEIVVPIIPLYVDQDQLYDLIGFLCIDCVSKEKFDEKYDPPLIEGVADGIYDILSIKIMGEKYEKRN
jgi:hypothetical protein